MGAIPAFSDSAYQVAAELVRDRTGLVFGDSRRQAFAQYLADATRRTRSRSPQRYLMRLAQEQELFDDLVAAMTVGETYFFRDPAQLDMVRDELLPALRSARPAGHRLRIWSAGCASGEEPYTLSMIARDAGVEPAPSIIGTDISREALALATEAKYGKWCFRGVDTSLIQRHFRADGARRWTLNADIRDSVEFGHLNLAADVYPSLATGIWGMDLIMCRNVLIYFDRGTVERVQRRLVDSLADGGYLVFGVSDPMLSDLRLCEPVVTGAGVVYRRGQGTASTARQGAATHRPIPAHRPIPPRPADPRTVLRPAVPILRKTDAEIAPAVPAAAAPDESLSALTEAYAEHDYARAEEIALRLQATGAGEAQVDVLLVRACANRGDLATAGRHCAAAIERHRDSAELHYLHSVLLAEAGHLTESVRAARSALYIDAGLVVAHMGLGTTLAKAGDHERARTSYRRASRLLNDLAPHDIVPASDGEPAASLAEMARLRLSILGGNG